MKNKKDKIPKKPWISSNKATKMAKSGFAVMAVGIILHLSTTLSFVNKFNKTVKTFNYNEYKNSQSAELEQQKNMGLISEKEYQDAVKTLELNRTAINYIKSIDENEGKKLEMLLTLKNFAQGFYYGTAFYQIMLLTIAIIATKKENAISKYFLPLHTKFITEIIESKQSMKDLIEKEEYKELKKFYNENNIILNNELNLDISFTENGELEISFCEDEPEDPFLQNDIK
jgi:hypothetical protein